MERPKGITAEVITLILLFVSFALLYFRPLWDADMWWHLANGRYIVENASIPTTDDPFSFPAVDTKNFRPILLSGYWLGQALMYLMYKMAGFYGLIALRVLLLCSIPAVIYSGLRGRPGASEWSIPIVVIAGFTCMYFTGLRPQIFTFLLSVVIVLLLERLEDKYNESTIRYADGLPLMLTCILWANLHRGFMIGSAIIMIYLLAEILRMAVGRQRQWIRYWRYTIILAASVVCTLINPNGYLPYVELMAFEGTVLQTKVSEFMSPIEYAVKYHQIVYPYFIYLVLTVIAVAASRSRMSIRHAILIAFTVIISIKSYRFVPFLAFATAPLLPRYLPELRFLRKYSTVTASLLLAITITACTIKADKTFISSFSNPVKQGMFPEGAADYIIDNHPPANIFNHYDWGGYLMWRLYPDYRVFIDGRVMSTRAFRDYTFMLWDTEKTLALLEKYHINTVIIPQHNPFTGETYPVLPFLINNPRWTLAYQDGLSYVLIMREDGI